MNQHVTWKEPYREPAPPPLSPSQIIRQRLLAMQAVEATAGSDADPDSARGGAT